MGLVGHKDVLIDDGEPSEGGAPESAPVVGGRVTVETGVPPAEEPRQTAGRHVVISGLRRGAGVPQGRPARRQTTGRTRVAHTFTADGLRRHTCTLRYTVGVQRTKGFCPREIHG